MVQDAVAISWSLDPGGSGGESELGDFTQPSLTQIQFSCKSCHHFPDVMVLFKDKGQTTERFIGMPRNLLPLIANSDPGVQIWFL